VFVQHIYNVFCRVDGAMTTAIVVVVVIATENVKYSFSFVV